MCIVSALQQRKHWGNRAQKTQRGIETEINKTKCAQQTETVAYVISVKGARLVNLEHVFEWVQGGRGRSSVVARWRPRTHTLHTDRPDIDIDPYLITPVTVQSQLLQTRPACADLHQRYWLFWVSITPAVADCCNQLLYSFHFRFTFLVWCCLAYGIYFFSVLQSSLWSHHPSTEDLYLTKNSLALNWHA